MASESLSTDDATIANPNKLSQNGQMIAIGVYGSLVLVGFFFGIVTGYERPKTVVVTKTVKEKEPPKVVEPPKPTPKVTPEPREEPKPVPKEEPKPEPKAVESPKPEPKKVEPKKVESKEPTPAAVALSFEKHVKPILRSYCFKCHGDPGVKPKGDVDMTSLAKITDPKNPPILVAGNPKKSAILTTIEDQSMPPQGSRPGKGETDVIRQWILDGAKPRRRKIPRLG